MEINSEYLNQLYEAGLAFMNNKISEGDFKSKLPSGITNNNENHLTIGIYPNGSYKTNVVNNQQIYCHIAYNLVLRPGRTFFCDGVCLNYGLNKLDNLEEMENKIKDITKETDLRFTTEPYV